MITFILRKKIQNHRLCFPTCYTLGSNSELPRIFSILRGNLGKYTPTNNK
jgi:hypothetical protein